jgi:hypothetical protein
VERSNLRPWDDKIKQLALSLDEQALILSALEDPPQELAKLRAVLLADHQWRRGKRARVILQIRPSRPIRPTSRELPETPHWISPRDKGSQAAYQRRGGGVAARGSPVRGRRNLRGDADRFEHVANQLGVCVKGTSQRLQSSPSRPSLNPRNE